MTSKEALEKLVYLSTTNEEKPNWLMPEIAELNKVVKQDLEQSEKLLKILKSNIIDYVVQYGNDHEAYNTATITIQVKTLKEFTEKMVGKEIHYTPCKSISNDDFKLLIDTFLRERN